ncbi:hypothetical protein [Phenylobacterium sp.]|uniref:hypothetical protein n=1 Tax=Phenylobacterium sp. TaxID=1871053 RepID=UPI0025DCE4C7|nr:hypothetical protein [Phenylobacterium sp.]
MTLVLPTPSRGYSETRPSTARLLLAVVVCVAAAAGCLATGSQAASLAAATAGADLTFLLRAMTAIKTLMAGGAIAAVAWRLSTPTTQLRLGAYALASAAMAVGPGLIWNMVHVGSGALFLHAGLLSAAVLLWRDPAVATRLAHYVAQRRASTALRR